MADEVAVLEAAVRMGDGSVSKTGARRFSNGGRGIGKDFYG